MAGYQQTTIVGNVGRDPSFKYTQGGVAVCDFSVAVTRRSGSGDNASEKTTWFRVTAWRELAETMNKFVHKGMQVMVVGTVEVSAYIDKNNAPQASLELTAQTVQFLGKREDNGGSGDYATQTVGADSLSEIPF